MRLSAVLLLSLAVGGAASAQAPVVCDTMASQRMRNFCSGLGRHETTEESFLGSVKGPNLLHELIPPRNVGDGLETFLWRGDDSTTAVDLDGPLPPLWNTRFNAGKRALSRIPGTHVWYRTERLPFDYRLNYDFDVSHKTASGVVMTESRDSLNTGDTLYGGSIAAGYFAPPEPWLKLLPAVKPGTLRRDSLFSKILRQERTFTIYQPHSGARPRALLIVFDGEHYVENLATPTVLDNLIGKDMIPPTIAVFVDTRRWDRQADLACNDTTLRFLNEELLPLLRQRGVIDRAIPASRTVIAGSSLGGLEAACAAFRNPAVFPNVIALSGSFFWYPRWPSQEASLSDETGWLTSELAHRTRKPLRWFVSTGTWEGDGLWENRRMRDVLIAKGYPLKYVEYSGGHDDVWWRDLIADGLIALLGH